MLWRGQLQKYVQTYIYILANEWNKFFLVRFSLILRSFQFTAKGRMINIYKCEPIMWHTNTQNRPPSAYISDILNGQMKLKVKCRLYFPKQYFSSQGQNAASSSFKNNYTSQKYDLKETYKKKKNWPWAVTKTNCIDKTFKVKSNNKFKATNSQHH